MDGLEFHFSQMTSAKERAAYKDLLRFDLLTPRVQAYGDTGIVSYTRLMTWAGDSGRSFTAYNESRVFARIDGEWKMVHFHRSKSQA